MVLYDNRNIDGENISGILYLSLMDIDYLISKYGIENLALVLPEYFLSYFADVLAMHEKEILISSKYFYALKLKISKKEDENLLELLHNEIRSSNLMTRKELESLSDKDIKFELKKLRNKIIATEIEDLRMLGEQSVTTGEKFTIEDLYRIRSLKMAMFISKEQKIIKKLDHLGDKKIKHLSQNEEHIKNLKEMAISPTIYESPYFCRQIASSKVILKLLLSKEW